MASRAYVLIGEKHCIRQARTNAILQTDYAWHLAYSHELHHNYLAYLISPGSYEMATEAHGPGLVAREVRAWDVNIRLQ